MAADITDFAAIQHEDGIRIHNGGEPVGNDQRGAALHQLGEGFLHCPLGGGIQRAGGFIQQQDRRVFEYRPGDGKALALPAGKFHAQRPDLGIIALWHGHDEFVRMGGTRGGHDFLAAGWTAKLFEQLFARREGNFQGLMICLYAQDRLVAGFKANVAKNLYGEDGAINKAAIAQVVNRANFDRVKGLFDDAVAQGATVAAGGVLEADDLTVHPTMLTNVTPQMQILQEEIFAPVLPVMTYDDLDQVIGYIEARDKPLALYIYSNDESTVERVLQRTSSGGVTVNGVFTHYLENQLPFGGVNHSGTGSYHGYFGFKAFSHERAVYRHQ